MSTHGAGSGDFVESRQDGRSEGVGDSRNFRVGVDYDPDAATRLSASTVSGGTWVIRPQLEQTRCT